MVTKTRMPVEDYLALVEEEGPYLEYIDGEAIRKPMPDWRHTVLAGQFNKEFGIHSDARESGFYGPEGRIRIDDEQSFSGRQYRLPDTSYWAPGAPFIGAEAMFPPTLAVEIRSPGQSMRSLRERCNYFREHGVEVVWSVDPDSRTVEVFEANVDGAVVREGDVLSTTTIPGLQIDVAKLFAAMDRAANNRPGSGKR